MGDVFANGRGVSGKATPNKSVAAFPSVCLSPPSPPAGPIPIPYPVTSMASETNDGTGSVIINKKEVGHKNGSVYEKCNGNQPATKSFGMDVLSHTLEGKTKFAAYSFDVMFEKDGAERFMDLTTSNHMNSGGAPMFSAEALAPPGPQQDADCKAMKAETAVHRGRLESAMEGRADSSQDKARRGTITVSVARPGGTPSATASNQMMRRALRNQESVIAEPKPLGDKPDRNKPVPSEICGGGHSHPGSDRARHCEAQAVDLASWKPTPPTSMTFAIDYPALKKVKGKVITQEKKKNKPCRFCKSLLKKACACKVAIYVCGDDGPVNYCQEIQDAK